MNPHTRYEVPVFKIPLALVIMFAALAVGAIIGTVYLEATQEDPGTWRELFSVKKIALPDVHSAIQREVDAHNPFLQAKGDR